MYYSFLLTRLTPFLAKERGIKIIEKKVSKEQDAPGNVTMKITSDKGTGSISGTVIGKMIRE